MSLSDYGYHFSGEGKLVDDEGKGFVFNQKDNREENQKRYEEIGELVTQHIYTLLETNLGLERLLIPRKSEEQGRSFIFMSPKFQEADKVCIFLNGAGVVRAGQWTRKLIINNSIEEGSMLPYIEKVQSLGYSVLCMNTNEKGPESQTPSAHADLVWKEFVGGCNATSIVFIAHSMGGAETIELASKHPEEFVDRVKALFFTDSVHTQLPQGSKINKMLTERGKNYVTSSLPRGSPARRSFIFGNDTMPRLSSGHTDHIWTSHYARESIFEQLEALNL